MKTAFFMKILLWCTIFVSSARIATATVRPVVDVCASSRLSSDLVYKTPYKNLGDQKAPPYFASMDAKDIFAYLKANGFRDETGSVQPEARFRESFAKYIVAKTPLMPAYSVEFGDFFVQLPKHLRFEKRLGSGDKGTVIGSIDVTNGQQLAVKVPVGRTSKEGRVDLAINLELEFWINAFLRQNFDTYGVRVIPVIEFEENGAYMAMPTFGKHEELGSVFDNLIRNSAFKAEFKSLLSMEGGDEQKKRIGELVMKAIPNVMDKEILSELESTFLGIQKVAETKGLNIDFVTDNAALISGHIVLFDTGIRTSPGSRSQKYTLGEKFDPAKPETKLTFAQWLELAHINWMVKAKQIQR